MFEFDPAEYRKTLADVFAEIALAKDVVDRLPEGDDIPTLLEAMQNGVQVLERSQPQSGDHGQSALEPADITQIGEYMLAVLDQLLSLSYAAQLHETAQRISGLSIPLGVWVSRSGGEIDNLAPVVDGFAAQANLLRDPEELKLMVAAMAEVAEATSDVIKADLDNSNQGRPWRVLLLNRCIVATRTLDATLMEAAFADLETYLPNDAPTFFKEGMEQMHIIGYPDHVREVMSKYHDRWHGEHKVH